MNFLVLGYYGFFNSGDDAILYAVCQDIKAQDENNKIMVMSNNPESTEKEYGVKAIPRFDMLKVIKEIRKADVVVFGGGSLLQDVTSSRSLTYYLTIMKIAKFFKKKTILYANGVGPINSKENQSKTAKVLNKLTKITVRDTESEKLLYDIGVSQAKVALTADPVYNLNTKSVNIDDIYKKHDVSLEKDKFVSVYFRKFGEDEGYISNLSKLFDKVQSELGLEILFVPMEYPSDYEASLKIKDQMKNNSFILNGRVEVPEMFEIIKNSKLVFGMRLHSLIYSSVVNTPMIAFSYDPKVDSFASQMGVDVAKYNDVDVDVVFQQIKNILENYEVTKENMNSNYSEIRSKSLKNVEALNELVKG